MAFELSLIQTRSVGQRERERVYQVYSQLQSSGSQSAGARVAPGSASWPLQAGKKTHVPSLPHSLAQACRGRLSSRSQSPYQSTDHYTYTSTMHHHMQQVAVDQSEAPGTPSLKTFCARPGGSMLQWCKFLPCTNQLRNQEDCKFSSGKFLFVPFEITTDLLHQELV